MLGKRLSYVFANKVDIKTPESHMSLLFLFCSAGDCTSMLHMLGKGSTPKPQSQKTMLVDSKSGSNHDKDI